MVLPAPAPPPEKKKPVVVLVDDDYDQVQGIEVALIELGYQVYYACDGNSGLALLKSVQPDLLILDLGMPLRSGFMILEQMRTRDEGIQCPVLVVTGIDGSRHREYALTLGVDAYYQKPYTIGEMVKTIQELVGKRNL